MNSTTEQKVIGQLLSVPLHLIRPMNGQPRSHFGKEELQELGECLKKDGQIQPAIVKKLNSPDEKGCIYELISGERRWQACEMVGIPELKVIVNEEMSSLQQYIQAVIANCHGVNLSTLEIVQAAGYLHNCGVSDMDIAKTFAKKSALWAYQHRRLLQLTLKVQKLLGPETPEEKRIPFNSALLLVELPPEEQVVFAEMISETGISAIQVGHMIRNRLHERGVKRRNRSSAEYQSCFSFFDRTNKEIELYIDHADQRISNLLNSRSQIEKKALLKKLRDCYDNLGVVLKLFEKAKDAVPPA